MTTTRSELIAEARTWLGTPFGHQQSTKGVAADCYGFLRGVARELGVVPEHQVVTDYANIPDGRMRALLLRDLQPVPFKLRKPGDVIALAWVGEIQHLGFLDMPGAYEVLLHAYGHNGHGAVVETTLTGRHLDAVRGVFRIPGVVD